MGVNKVKYGENVVIDISSDTVTADKLMRGYTAHDNTGAAITGTATDGGGNYRLTYDKTTSVGSAIVGEAEVGEAFYTPSGDIVMETEDVNVVTGASIACSYSNATLTIRGIAIEACEISVPKNATFNGSGVTFRIESVEE